VSVIVACSAAVLLLDRVLRGPPPSLALASPPRVASPPAAEHDGRALALLSQEVEAAGRASVDPEAPRPRSALELLQEHWGERWPEIRERNRASEEWLARYPVESLKPWEEVSTLVLDRALASVAKERENEEYLQLSDERGLVDLSNATVHLRTPEGTVRDFEAIRERGKEGEAQLRAASTAYWDELMSTISRRWLAGEIEHHPILSSYDPPPEHALYSHSGVAYGWAYAIALSPEEEPELARLAGELESLRIYVLGELADLVGAQ
jgi:hypothetical protein